ncbi:hypothetical protein B0H14DRAFT_3430823 [Mycena olivaceomarginata]|nr:hypothetical protein B0H14DRAFT_3482638 [Mycena olivaceomarginata]KAJ7887332.1 hypothetical protein B0H14DRAFT_3430823 [Mycena olivaceomarginata]
MYNWLHALYLWILSTTSMFDPPEALEGTITEISGPNSPKFYSRRKSKSPVVLAHPPLGLIDYSAGFAYESLESCPLDHASPPKAILFSDRESGEQSSLQAHETGPVGEDSDGDSMPELV